MTKTDSEFRTIYWEDNQVVMLDQRYLPAVEQYNRYTTVQEVADAIQTMVIRGAPAIGVAAGYGVALAALQDGENVPDLKTRITDAFQALAQSRPTAVNLFWALDRMKAVIVEHKSDGDDKLTEAIIQEAQAIHDEDISLCRSIGDHGKELLSDESVVLTHCNAGALATAGWGTALGIVRSAKEAGKNIRVFADETRPYFQGARLTAWELQKDEIDVTVISDSAAASFIARGEVDVVIVGADRIAANGDTANKIGTYGVALAAHEAGIPFYVAAPWSTIDLKTGTGEDIPIEERHAREVTHVGDIRVVPRDIPVRNPAFDVTPHKLITAIITDRGIIRPPFDLANFSG